MEENERDEGAMQPNPGYALFQLAKALTTQETHSDPDTRARAERKIAKWMTVYNGLMNGKLNVGSRTPVADTPAWATLEVVTGGFATGTLLAGGPLLDHETSLRDKLPPQLVSEGRDGLNAYFMTEQGLGELRDRLRSGCYDVSVPEEGALLVVAWLADNGHAEEARALIDEIAPFFGTLRFYPAPAESPRRFGSRVYLQDVASTIEAIRSIRPNQRILAQKEAIEVWTPLYDRAIELFLETVSGATPILRRQPNGNRVTNTDGTLVVDGGWPCQEYAPDWRNRAKALLDEYQRLRREHRLCGKPERTKDSFAQLRKHLRSCVKDPASLCGRDVARIRLILGRYVAKRSVPGSEPWKGARQTQALQASPPTHYEISRAVLPRFQAYPRDTGLDDLTPVTRPITAEESTRFSLPEDTTLPSSLQRKIQRCLSDTVEALVERGVVKSGETLARVLPQMTSGLRAAGIADPVLRRLYSATYQAFRRRRSLLLLDLEKQVQIEELPWIAATERFRSDTLSTKELSRQVLEEISVLTIVSFPHVVLPNKLIQELRALVKGAGLNVPLVDEVAADIFMGAFSGKFVEAAKRAGTVLQGTLYETYFGINYDDVQGLPSVRGKKRSWFRRQSPDPFVELCSARAGVKYGGWNTAVNGMIIEQQQILTTQNLAGLFQGLELVDTLAASFGDLSKRCFEWICRRQQVKANKHHARLIMVKNTAYAWRQMIFYLSLQPTSELHEFLEWAQAHLSEQPQAFQIRFQPALNGLAVAASGGSLDSHASRLQGAKRFLGWTNRKHWLLT